MARRKKLQTYTLFIPESIDIDTLLQKNKPNFPFKRDKFVYMIHLINQVCVAKKDEESEFTKLFAPLLKDKFGTNYKRYLEYLIERNIIVCNNHYSVTNHISKGYKFTEIHKKSILKEVKITDNKTIDKVKTFTNLESGRVFNILPETPKHSIQIFEKWFNDKLTIDISGVEKKLEEMKSKELSQNSRVYESYMTNKEDKALKKEYENLKDPYRAYSRRMMPALTIKNKQYLLNKDRTSGRLHSPLTQLKKVLRQYLRYDGEKLVSIDIKNSQPYLSTVLFNRNYFNLNKMGARLKLYNNSVDYKKSPIAFHYVSQKVPPEDVGVYISQVTKGNFYEEFAEQLVEKGLLSADIADKRKEAKNITFTSFFSPNRLKQHVEEIKLFEEIYPNVYKNFAFVKKGKHHNTLACVLQNLEAEIILEDICKKIAFKYPEAPIFTIHDSIVTTNKYLQAIKQIMEEVLIERVGYPPVLTIEKW